MKSRVLGVLAVCGMVSVPLLAHLRTGDDGKPVFVESIAKREVRASVLTSGTLVYENQAALSPEVIGRVQRVLVREGDLVK